MRLPRNEIQKPRRALQLVDCLFHQILFECASLWLQNVLTVSIDQLIDLLNCMLMGTTSLIDISKALLSDFPPKKSSVAMDTTRMNKVCSCSSKIVWPAVTGLEPGFKSSLCNMNFP